MNNCNIIKSMLSFIIVNQKGFLSVTLDTFLMFNARLTILYALVLYLYVHLIQEYLNR